MPAWLQDQMEIYYSIEQWLHVACLLCQTLNFIIIII